MKIIKNSNYEDDYSEYKLRLYRVLSYNDIVIAERLCKNYEVKYMDNEYKLENGIETFRFEVAESLYIRYNCILRLNEYKDVVSKGCTCNRFKLTESCKHLASCFCKCSDVLLSPPKNNPKEISNELMDKYISNGPTIKKEVFVELEFNSDEMIDKYFYYGRKPEIYYDVKVNLGTDKMYSLNNHTNNFLSAHFNHTGECVFGKKFKYRYDDFFLVIRAKQ